MAVRMMAGDRRRTASPPEQSASNGTPQAAQSSTGDGIYTNRGTKAFADSCLSDKTARDLEDQLRKFGLKQPAWLVEWLARLLISICPLVTGVIWFFAPPSREAQLWTAMYIAALVFVLWSTRQQFRKLDESECAVDALVAPQSLYTLLDEPRRRRILSLLAAAVPPVAFACAIDWIWRGSPRDITWFVTAGWTVFWIVGSFWGTRGSLWRLAKKLRDLPKLDLIRHAPARTPGLQVLRGFAERFWRRLAIVIVLVTAPLAWGTFLAIERNQAATVALLAIDVITFLGLVVWLAQGAYPADRNLTAVAREARNTMLDELRPHLPKGPDKLLTPAGQRAIGLYNQIADEPLDVDRRWRWIGVIASLTPTAVAILKALSAVHLPR